MHFRSQKTATVMLFGEKLLGRAGHDSSFRREVHHVNIFTGPFRFSTIPQSCPVPPPFPGLHSGFPPRQVDARSSADARGSADAHGSADACLSLQKVQGREANRRRHWLT